MFQKLRAPLTEESFGTENLVIWSLLSIVRSFVDTRLLMVKEAKLFCVKYNPPVTLFKEGSEMDVTFWMVILAAVVRLEKLAVAWPKALAVTESVPVIEFKVDISMLLRYWFCAMLMESAVFKVMPVKDWRKVSMMVKLPTDVRLPNPRLW